MLYHPKPCRLATLAFATALLSGAVAGRVYGQTGINCGGGCTCQGGEVGCLPTPHPCTADGVCRPNRLEWGYNKTRWRLWPGEKLEQEPTAAEETGVDEEMQLPPLERPPAIKEDIRGPGKTRSAEPGAEPADESAPQEMPEADLPEPEADPLEDFNLQGNMRIETQQEDVPPELPESLLKFSQSTRGNLIEDQLVAQVSTTAMRGSGRQQSGQDSLQQHRRSPAPGRSVGAVAIEPQTTTLRLVNPY